MALNAISFLVLMSLVKVYDHMLSIYIYIYIYIYIASSKQTLKFGLVTRQLDVVACKQQRRGPVSISAKSYQCLCFSLSGKYMSKLTSVKF